MPVRIIGQPTFLDEFNTTPSYSFKGSIGDKITYTINFELYFETANTSFDVSGNTITRNDTISPDNGSFVDDGFRVGDNIRIEIGANTVTRQITDLTDDYVIVDGASLSTETDTVGNIYYDDTFGGIEFFYGVFNPSAGGNFRASLVDGTIQKFKPNLTLDASGLATKNLIISTTSKAWRFEDGMTATIEEKGIVNYRHKFEIVLEFVISPVFLANHLVNGSLDFTQVNYLYNSATLHFDFEINGTKVLNGNVRTSSSEGDSNKNLYPSTGNIGWFNENLNGGTATYLLDSISYTDSQTGNSVTSILPNKITNISVDLQSLNSTFITNSKFIINVYRTPTDETVYQNTSTYLSENFLVSRVIIDELNPSLTGNGFIQDAYVNIIDSENASIEFNFSPTFFTSQSQVLDDLQAFNENPSDVADGYLIFITTQDFAITDLENTDKVAVLCDVNRAAFVSESEFYNIEGAFEVVDGIKFNEHSTDEVLKASTDYKGWVEDGVLIRARLRLANQTTEQSIDGGGEIVNNLTPNSFNFTIEAQNIHDTDRNFILYNKEFDANTDINEVRDFDLPDTELKNKIIFTEDTPTVSDRFWDMSIGFKLRWEDWITRSITDSDFPSSTEDWVGYINNNWKITANILANVDLVQVIGEDETCPISITLQLDQSNSGFMNFSITSGNKPIYNYPNGNKTHNETSENQPLGSTEDNDVVICFEDKSLINSIELRGNSLDGDLDLTDFSNLNSLTITNEGGLDTISNILASLTNVKIQNCGISSLDFSSCPDFNAGVSLKSLENCNSILFGTNTAGTAFLEIRNTAVTSLDFSGIKLGSGICAIQGNLSLTSLTYGQTQAVLSSISLTNSPDLNTLDLSPLNNTAQNNTNILFINMGFDATLVNQILTDIDGFGWTATTAVIDLRSIGTGTWNSSNSYDKRKVINYSGSQYISLVSSNKGNQPDISPLYWKDCTSAAPTGVGLTAKTNLQGKGWTVNTN